jgi:hypothetical protein
MHAIQKQVVVVVAAALVALNLSTGVGLTFGRKVSDTFETSRILRLSTLHTLVPFGSSGFVGLIKFANDIFCIYKLLAASNLLSALEQTGIKLKSPFLLTNLPHDRLAANIDVIS